MAIASSRKSGRKKKTVGRKAARKTEKARPARARKSPPPKAARPGAAQAAKWVYAFGGGLGSGSNGLVVAALNAASAAARGSLDRNRLSPAI